MEVRGAAGQDGEGAGRIGLQLLGLEAFPEADGEDAGDHRVHAILRCRCGISLTAAGTFTRMRYGAGSVCCPTKTARRADGGNAANGFHSTPWGRIDPNPTRSAHSVAIALASFPGQCLLSG